MVRTAGRLACAEHTLAGPLIQHFRKFPLECSRPATHGSWPSAQTCLSFLSMNGEVGTQENQETSLRLITPACGPRWTGRLSTSPTPRCGLDLGRGVCGGRHPLPRAHTVTCFYKCIPGRDKIPDLTPGKSTRAFLFQRDRGHGYRHLWTGPRRPCAPHLPRRPRTQPLFLGFLISGTSLLPSHEQPPTGYS